MFDVAVIGAGLAGATVAERLARAGASVVVVERRAHPGGTASDGLNSDGVFIQHYGAHIFHTNSLAVWRYLSQFTTWRHYEHRVRARVGDLLVPFPINLDTVNTLYGLDLDSAGVRRWFAAGAEPVARIRTAEDAVVSQIGRDLFETFYAGYTRRQWGCEAHELAANVTARIPIRDNRDDRYFTDRFQGIPTDGYTALVARMLAHEQIMTLFSTTWLEAAPDLAYRDLIVTGPLDQHFAYCYGELPWRSMRFDFDTYQTAAPGIRWQPVATINYPDGRACVRTSEFTHLTGQQIAATTIVSETPTADGEPLYPVPAPASAALARRYLDLAATNPHLHVVGRLGSYRYYNMDQVVAQSLTLAQRLIQAGS